MTCAPPRILLVGDQAEARSFAARILGWFSPDQPAEKLIRDLRLDEIALLSRLGGGDKGPQTKEYWLAVIWHVSSSTADSVEVVRRLAEAAPALPVILFTESSPASLSQALAEFVPAAQLLIVPPLQDETMIRHWLAAQWDRRDARCRIERLNTALGESRAQLSHAIQEVRQITRAKEEFLANISHEIRTPMNSILGFSRLLLRESLESSQREKVEFVCDAANSLMRLMENLLDFSKLSKGSLGLSSVPFQVDEVIREVLNAAQPAAQQKGLALHCHIEQAVPVWLEGDHSRLQQILSNLVSNAVKFTERGTVHVRATVDEQNEESAALRIVINDTGLGIPQDRQALVFDSFYQADGSITRRFGGVGLGLSLSKQLLDLMGGQLGFRSTPGQGSSFWFTVPLKQHRPDSVERSQDAGRQSRSLQWANSPQSPPTSSRQCRVLVAEDEYLNRALIELLLTRAGCFVDLVGNGREALEVLRWNVYDLVFMDLQMPKMDGLEAIRLIRRDERDGGRDRHTRIIAVTGDVMQGDREKCLAAGADDYLPKPFAVEELLEAVHRQIPDFLASSQTKAHGQRDYSQTAPPEQVLTECLANLDQALKQQNFQAMEHCARMLKSLTGRDRTSAVADHAMRIQLAARNQDGPRAAEAVDRLRRTLRLPPTPSPHTALSLCN